MFNSHSPKMIAFNKHKTHLFISLFCASILLFTACAPTQPAAQQMVPAAPLQPTLQALAGEALLTVAATPNPTTAPTATSPAVTQVPQEAPLPATSQPPTAAPTNPAPLTRFAVIGDYGAANSPEAAVATLVKSWNPDFIITTGDNNYPNGEQATIDDNIGQFYHEYIYPYKGKYGQGASSNRFFPTLGNHDWQTPGAQPYLDYFTLPNNERYYDFTWGPVHFFAIDADSREPDGVSSNSPQAMWLKAQLAASTSPWNVVYFHQPAYSSGIHGPTDWMQWPFKKWGASVVMSGHDHTYERLQIDGLTYFVNGLGGDSRYNFPNMQEGSQVRYNDDYGAMLVTANEQEMSFGFINTKGEVIDTFSLSVPISVTSSAAMPIVLK